MLGSILKEYGIKWAWNRGLYSLKLKLLCDIPVIENVFERRVEIKRLDLFDIDVACLQAYIKKLPDDAKAALIHEADDAIDGKILGFSSIILDYGNPINWQLNPMTGKQTDKKLKWYQIPDFHTEIGDIKVIWEASRFTHLVTLARVFLLKDDIRYYEAFSNQMKTWIEQNPYSYGANYKCGQECSIRAVNALFAYTVFHGAGMTTSEDEDNLKKIILYSYKKVLSNFFYAYKCIKNNHTISEVMGMIIGAWCCEDDRQLQKAYSYLENAIMDQFTEDGGYAQFSFNYQRLALQDLDVIISISHKIKFVLSEKAKKRICNSALLLYQCQADNGDVPNYGSNDGALVFQFTSCGYRDFRPVINTTIALLTGQGVYEKGEKDLFREELIWYGIADTIDATRLNIVRQDISSDGAGIYTLRQAHTFIMLVLNSYRKRPGHMDQMHIDLWVNDINVLCDGGTYSYASELGQKLIREDIHNTISVSNMSQMNIRPPFLIYDWTSSKKMLSQSNMIGGTMLSKNGYTHHRVVRTTEGGFEVDDRVEARENSVYSINFHTICEAKSEGNKVFLLFGGRLLATLVLDGEFAIMQSIRSLYYLQKEKTTVIRLKGKIRKEEHRITKILIEEQ